MTSPRFTCSCISPLYYDRPVPSERSVSQKHDLEKQLYMYDRQTCRYIMGQDRFDRKLLHFLPPSFFKKLRIDIEPS